MTDSAEMLELLGEVVRNEGYTPSLAETAFQAIEYMENNSFYSAIIDVVLPDHERDRAYEEAAQNRPVSLRR